MISGLVAASLDGADFDGDRINVCSDNIIIKSVIDANNRWREIVNKAI